MAVRDALSSTDTVIARVRASYEARGIDWRALPAQPPSGETAEAIRHRASIDERFLNAIADADLARAGTRFAEHYPALVRWRERTIHRARRSRPADIAAAYELLAVQCLLAGESELADRARAKAVAVMTGASNSHHARSA